MTTKKEYKRYRDFEGFENLDQSKDPFEQMLEGVYFDMMSRNDDKEVKGIKDAMSSKILSVIPNDYIIRRAVTYPELYNNFKGGKWDHKVPAKKVADSYYHNTEKNSKGKDAAVFATDMPGDDKQVYDHDLWGNISYGYTMRAAGIDPSESSKAALADDFVQSLKSRGKAPFDRSDDPMVQMGIDLYDKYEGQGKKMTVDDFRNEILANKDKLRRYKKEDLTLRRDRRQEGDTLETVAARNNISADTLKAKNPFLNDAEQTVNRPILPTKSEREEGALLDKYRGLYKDKETEQTKIPEGILGREKETKADIKPKANGFAPLPEGQTYEEIYERMKNLDNRKEDILYKRPESIPESELEESLIYEGYELHDPELKSVFQNKAKNWFEYYYGTEPMKRDAAGRQIDSGPKYKIPEEVVEPVTLDFVPMSEAYRKVAEQTSPLGIKSLQKGLNNLYNKDYKKIKLKEDNVLGPKTVSRMKEALVGFGTEAVNRSIKVGGFDNMLEENRKRDIDNDTLKNTMSLLRPRDGGVFLQRGINGISGNNSPAEKLKEDNLIGPVTMTAFNKIKEEKEDELKKYVGENITSKLIR